jgi:hypothetical protein
MSEFENRMLKRISGLKRDEIRGRWRKLHHEQFHNSYLSQNIMRMTVSKGVRWRKECSMT